MDVELKLIREGLQREAASVSAKAGANGVEGGFRALLKPGVRGTALKCCTLQAFQQLCGVNAIVYFTPQILAGCGVVKLFERWGVAEDYAPMYATILAYLPKMPTALLTGYLIDRLGRRQLLNLFTPLLTLTLVGLALSFGGTSRMHMRMHMRHVHAHMHAPPTASEVRRTRAATFLLLGPYMHVHGLSAHAPPLQRPWLCTCHHTPASHYDTYMRHAHATRTCDTHMRHAHATRTCDTYMRHAQARRSSPLPSPRRL